MPKLSTKGIAVKSAFLHQAVIWPSIIPSEVTLNNKKVAGLEMTLIPQGLLLKARRQYALIPAANVAIMVLEGDPTSDEEVKDVKELK